MARRWHPLTSRTAYEDARVRVLDEQVVQPDGTEASYTVLEERQGAVVVVAADGNGRIVFVRQHRYPIDATTLELPAGEVSDGSEPIVQARRELWEEAGVSAKDLQVIGRFAPWPARARRWCDVVVARHLDLTKLGVQGQEGDESIETVVLIEPRDVQELIRTGQIFDGPSLSALAMFWAHTNDPS